MSQVLIQVPNPATQNHLDLILAMVILLVQSHGSPHESPATYPQVREWAHVEGDLRCPSPPNSERESDSRSAPGLHLWLV